MVEANGLRDVLFRRGEAGELQVDIPIFWLRLSQRHEYASSAFVLVFECQSLGEREHVSLVVTISNGGAAEGRDRLVDIPGLNGQLSATKPFGSVAEVHLAVARGDGARDEKCGNSDDDKSAELENLPVNERRSLFDFVSETACFVQTSSRDWPDQKSQLSTC